jgi:hypothetical protein
MMSQVTRHCFTPSHPNYLYLNLSMRTLTKYINYFIPGFEIDFQKVSLPLDRPERDPGPTNAKISHQLPNSTNHLNLLPLLPLPYPPLTLSLIQDRLLIRVSASIASRCKESLVITVNFLPPTFLQVDLRPAHSHGTLIIMSGGFRTVPVDLTAP